jgi:hypothetical protein
VIEKDERTFAFFDKWDTGTVLFVPRDGRSNIIVKIILTAIFIGIKETANCTRS